MLEFDFVSELDIEAPIAIVVSAIDSASAVEGVEPSSLQRWLAEARRRHFTGKAGEIVELMAETPSALRPVLIVGCGDGAFDLAGAAIVRRWLTASIETGAVVIANDGSAEVRAKLARGAALRAWRFDRYRTELKPQDAISLRRLAILTPSGAIEKAIDLSRDDRALVAGVHFARELVTEPGNMVYPESFVERCQRLLELGVEVTVLGPEEMATLGMNALLGVARGSARPPRLLIMRWDGTDGREKRPIAFVGKGVTFDSGGISIKPPVGMADMKWDMGGAGAVAGAMMAIAGRKTDAHVVGVCGLVENMPDGNAQRPGDVVKTMSGRTVEVIDTDAEGRLVLCDAVTWVQRTHDPRIIVDVATLTGAVIVSLGHDFAGLYCNEDDLAQRLIAAGTESGDRLWRMPVTDAHDEPIQSEIADLRNLGTRGGGSSTAARFIQRFVEPGVAWAHLDIAGMAWSDKDRGFHGKGATGYGVALLDKFVSDTARG